MWPERNGRTSMKRILFVLFLAAWLACRVTAVPNGMKRYHMARAEYTFIE